MSNIINKIDNLELELDDNTILSNLFGIDDSNLLLSLDIDSLKPAAKIPVGIAIAPIPIKEVVEAIILPATVIGTESPYPTALTVVIDHHRHLGIDPNNSGWTEDSDRYINVLLLKSSNNVYTVDI